MALNLKMKKIATLLKERICRYNFPAIAIHSLMRTTLKFPKDISFIL